MKLEYKLMILLILNKLLEIYIFYINKEEISFVIKYFTNDSSGFLKLYLKLFIFKFYKKS